VTVLRIPRDALEENLAANPGFSLRFYQALGMLLSHRLRTTLDPETVCQDAIDAGLVVHRAHSLELMTLDGAREQYAAQLRQLDRQALLKEIEQLRRLLTDLPPPRDPVR
jgi:CRP-like cAMP-binding protein